MSKKNNKIVIIGAGLAACFMALNLAKRGYSVDIYESRPDVRKNPYDSGRSFNLTFYGRGVRLMQQMGIWNEVKKNGVMVEGNFVHGLEQQTYDPQKTGILYTVHRNVFNGTLLDIIEKMPGINIHFNTRAVAIDQKKKSITLQKEGTQKTFSVSAEIVIGADGIHSMVRKEIQAAVILERSDRTPSGDPVSRSSSFQDELTYESMGYKEAHITKEQAKKLSLQLKKTHAWPREDSLLLAFPNNDGSFTLMLNFNLEGKNSLATLTSDKKVGEYLKNNFNDLAPLFPEMTKALVENPTGRFATLNTKPWYSGDFLVLIGDAAHACIPFYGQGTYAAFDDVMSLCKLIDQFSTPKADWSRIFPLYQEERKKNTDILAQLSKENFQELRDKSRSLHDLLKKKADTLLSKFLPMVWVPPIFMSVAHGNRPYVEELSLFKRQQKMARYIGLDAALQLLAFSFNVIRRNK